MTKWYKLLAREGVDVTTLSQIDIVFYDLIRQATKNRDEIFFSILKDRNFTHYIGSNSQEIGRFAYQKHFRSPKQIIKYYKDGKLLLGQIKKDACRWSALLSQQPTNKNFLLAYKNFRASFKKISYIYSIISWIGIEIWQTDFEQILNKIIARNNLDAQTEAILTTVYKPWKKTALTEIQKKLAKGQSPKHLAREYQFLRSWSVIWHKPITEEWVKSIKSSSRAAKPTIYSQAQLLKLLQPTEKEKKFLNIAPYIIFFKDWRDDVRRWHAYRWSSFFDLLGQKFDVGRDDLGYLTIDEIEKMLRTGILDKNVIKKRKQGCVITITKGKLTMRALAGIPLKYAKIAREINEHEQEKVVRGKTAQPGTVRGVVKIVHSYHDIKRVQVDDILVANTTHPNYLSAMHKAAAFVTNEGGMISHAAIMAREMKKPCIVGAGNATKILMEGDLVEVDANKGIVKLLKRQA